MPPPAGRPAPSRRARRPAIDPASVSAVYDRYAALYDRLYGRVLQDGRERLARCLEGEARPGQRLVEFGVGSGLMLPLYPRGLRVVGLDLSDGMLEQARARVSRLGLDGIELRRVDAEHTGLPGASFDHVVLPYVYSVTPEPDALAAEALRLCRAGGSIWILNHFSGMEGRPGPWRWLERPLRPLARWIGFRTEFPFADHVERLPWQVVAVHRANLMGLSRIVHVRKAG